ncbi:MAG: type IV pilin [Halobacteriales archaeon SW_9_67_24]|nr:MAG: type IV pilin [Halobacteriales archaeon SW_9_67_24]
MNLFTQSSGNDRAVSPVIGVVLMIAVVVILAAVVGAFATGVFGGQSDAPQAAFSYDSGDLTMDSGENIPSEQLTVTTDGTEASGSWSGSGDVTAGDTYEFTSDPADDATIKVIWTSEDGDNSATLFDTSV